MYFIIVGQHKDIIQEALSYLHPTNLMRYSHDIITFDTSYPERLATAWFVIKRGVVCDTKDLSDLTSAYSLLGTVNKDVGMMLKKQLPHIKRYKLVEFIHTDFEVKTEGVEIMNIDGKKRGVVQWYQNIPLYETIDFDKPVGGMTIGMMPSKLAHTLINIGVWEYEKTQLKSSTLATQSSQPLTIRDPFCGFGTTNLLANHLWYNTIASDIKVTSCKQNMKRRETQDLSQDAKVLVVKQDVTEPLSSPLFRYADIIVSEWWLGHIITNATRPKEAENSSIAVEKLYKSFFDNLTAFLTQKERSLTLVMTIPVWIKHNHNFSVSESIKAHAISLWREARLVKEPYSRDKQLVGRQVLIANK